MQDTKGRENKTATQVDPAPENAREGAVVDASAQQPKKRGSSRSARRLEDIESRASKTARRLSKAVDRGVSTYIKGRDKSARKRRDGALVDFCENVSKGVATAVSESAPALTDFAKALNSRRVRKQIRKAVRITPLL